MTRVFRVADAWQVDVEGAVFSSLARNLYTNSMTMGSYDDELQRMQNIFGNNGVCEPDHATHTWCRTSDRALIVGVSTFSERFSFGSFTAEASHSISGRYDSTREQSGAARQLMDETIKAYGFSDQELDFCRSETRFSINSQLMNLSCQTNETAVSFTITSYI